MDMYPVVLTIYIIISQLLSTVFMGRIFHIMLLLEV